MIIGSNIIELDSIDSTNLYLNQLVRNTKVEEGTVVFAKEQSSGRGQVNNTWESSFGENLLMSIALYPFFLDASSQFLLSKFVSLSIFNFLTNYLDNVKIKWPNDIYVANRKIAGVLIENSLSGATISSCIVGIGLNINQTEFSSLIPNPTSLKKETKELYDLTKLRNELLEFVENWYNILKNNSLNKINDSYLNALYQFEEFCQYSDDNGDFKAKITGVDECGLLCMTDLNNKSRKYAFKEVRFL